jgi:hypothetical protein
MRALRWPAANVVVLLFSGLMSSAASKAPGDPPIVRTQPIARTVTDGNHVTFAVALQPDTAPVRFQWWRDEQPLADNARVGGTTNSVLNIDPAQLADAGQYFVVASNSVGATTSAVVSLVVSQLVFNFTPVPGTGAWLNIPGQIGDVYRIEVNTNFTGYRTNGYATNVSGVTQYFDRDPGTGFRQLRLRFDHMLPVLSVGEADYEVIPFAKAGPVSLAAYGKLKQVWRFESSSGLTQWFHVSTVTNTMGWLQIRDPTIDPGDEAPPRRFYRIAPAQP